MGGEQGRDFRAQDGIPAAPLYQDALALRSRAVEGGMEQLIDLSPTLRVHSSFTTKPRRHKENQ